MNFTFLSVLYLTRDQKPRWSTKTDGLQAFLFHNRCCLVSLCCQTCLQNWFPPHFSDDSLLFETCCKVSEQTYFTFEFCLSHIWESSLLFPANRLVFAKLGDSFSEAIPPADGVMKNVVCYSGFYFLTVPSLFVVVFNFCISSFGFVQTWHSLLMFGSDIVWQFSGTCVSHRWVRFFVFVLFVLLFWQVLLCSFQFWACAAQTCWAHYSLLLYCAWVI